MYTVEGVPVVAAANIGYTFVAVVVSLLNAAPPVAVAHAAVPPETVNTWPVEPIPNRVELLAPLPTIKSPAVVTGAKALNAAAAVVWPVPPLPMATVPVTLAAVPVVFWFSVGMSAATMALKVGAPAVPLGAAST